MVKPLSKPQFIKEEVNEEVKDDVKEDVKRKIETLGSGGGYVLASCHTVRSEVPAENIVAMYEAGKEFGKY